MVVHLVNIYRRLFMWAMITGWLFMCKPTHARAIVILSPSCSPYCGILSYKQFSYIYILTSEQFYRGPSRTANGSIHIYSIYHRLMHAKSSTELHRRFLVGFLLTKRDISNYRRPIAGVSLSEPVKSMTSQRKWRVSASAWDNCVAICK